MADASSPKRRSQPACPDVGWAPAGALARYAEHGGDINDEELGGEPGAYLAQMAEAGIGFSGDDPLVLNVVDGRWASVYDGNHRLHLALAHGPDTPVPYRIVWDQPTTWPGAPWVGVDGATPR